MKKILFVIGSLRKQSFNRQVSEYVQGLLNGKAQVAKLDYVTLPFVNQDIEFPAPDVLMRVRQEVLDADALWIFSPEYNYSYPAAVKNLFDWLSRPMTTDRNSTTAIRGKKVVLTGIGGGNQTKDCREKLTNLLNFIGAEVMPLQVGLAVNVEAWKNNVVILTNDQKAQLKAQVEETLRFIE
jgi:NAD(P)H-dependent FMN reductase